MIFIPKAGDLVGKVFTYLTVIEKTDKRKGGAIVWNCQCKCGNFKEATTGDLNAKRVQSCGCYNTEVHRNLYVDKIGQKFGRLTVIEKTDKRSKSRGVIWKCRCDCGNIVEVEAGALTDKDRGTKSCGCLQKEKAAENGRSCAYDLTGQRFGKLVVQELVEDAEKRSWKCLCDCGNTYVVTSKNLLNRKVSSCGCLGKSLGEYTIERILNENGIRYIAQHSFENCVFPDTGYRAFFDFYIDNKYVLEYDGQQHFSPQCFSGMGKDSAEEQFAKTQYRDSFKNEWCQKNNVPLIRIPYTHLKDICLNDLLLETSNFIYKKETD